MQPPIGDYIICYKEDEEATEVDQGAARLGDVHHIHVDVGGGAAEVGFDHGRVAVFQGGDPLLYWGGEKRRKGNKCVLSERGEREAGREGGLRARTLTQTYKDTYLNNPGRREQQPRGDAAEAEDTRDSHVERARDLERRRKDGTHNCLHRPSMGARDDEDKVDGEFAYMYVYIYLVKINID